MMRVITGEIFNTSHGMIIVHNEQNLDISAGDVIRFNGQDYKVKRLIPPTTPNSKWSIKI